MRNIAKTSQSEKIVTPLYGHFDIETGYVVSSYPSGSYKVEARFWMERDAKRGFRSVSVTRNPISGAWNSPKNSGYSVLAGNLYLDEKEHVRFDSLSYGSTADVALSFVLTFRDSDFRALRPYAVKMIATTKNAAGVPGMSESGRLEQWKNAGTWERVVEAIPIRLTL